MESRKRLSHSKSNIKNSTEKRIDREQALSDLKEKSLYDSKEAFEILGISLQSLRRAIEKGTIKTVRLGARYLRIPASEIERLAQGESVLLSVEEASEIIGVSKHMIRAWIKSGKISAFRLADFGPFKIPKSELDRIAKEGISK